MPLSAVLPRVRYLVLHKVVRVYKSALAQAFPSLEELEICSFQYGHEHLEGVRRINQGYDWIASRHLKRLSGDSIGLWMLAMHDLSVSHLRVQEFFADEDFCPHNYNEITARGLSLIRAEELDLYTSACSNPTILIKWLGSGIRCIRLTVVSTQCMMHSSGPSTDTTLLVVSKAIIKTEMSLTDGLL